MASWHELRQTFPVVVTEHARKRARERFPGFKLARIVDEVRAAIKCGRLSSRKPEGIIHPNDRTSLYAWTEDGERVYALRHDADAFYVTTTMRKGVPE